MPSSLAPGVTLKAVATAIGFALRGGGFRPKTTDLAVKRHD
jgi:hypothetical protein